VTVSGRCRCSKHLVVHGGISTSRRLGTVGTGGDHGVIASLSCREVIGHLGVELLYSLLLVALTPTTSAAATSSGFTSSTSTSGGRGSRLRSRGRLWLVLLRLTIFVSSISSENIE